MEGRGQMGGRSLGLPSVSLSNSLTLVTPIDPSPSLSDPHQGQRSRRLSPFGSGATKDRRARGPSLFFQSLFSSSPSTQSTPDMRVFAWIPLALVALVRPALAAVGSENTTTSESSRVLLLSPSHSMLIAGASPSLSLALSIFNDRVFLT